MYDFVRTMVNMSEIRVYFDKLVAAQDLMLMETFYHAIRKVLLPKSALTGDSIRHSSKY